MVLTRKHVRFFAYLNIDNDYRKIRGLYLRGDDLVWPICQQLLSPFRDLEATILRILKTWGTDPLARDAVGMADFQFIQDRIKYGSRTHLANMDSYDRTQAADLTQA